MLRTGPNAAFAAFNSIVASWAFVSYIGIGNALVDIWHGLTDWMYVDIKQSTPVKVVQNPTLDWRAVLYHGDTNKHLPLGVDDLEEATT